MASLIRMERQPNLITHEENFVKLIWSLIGIDPESYSDYVNLNDLGVGSIVSMELKQRLVIEYGINF